MERSVLTDRCVFVKTAREQGYFNTLEVAAYDAWYNGVITTLPNVVRVSYRDVYLLACKLCESPRTIVQGPNVHVECMQTNPLVQYANREGRSASKDHVIILACLWQVPDAFVYLRADPNVCYERLKAR